ncbi:ABC transporter ATP-binding protein [Robertmurraya korlensis]|uniref:ABC transporter ATP-binding protein n=1 Tax=Robertmurraya korlensis TaxID=519977 RepID=UPI00204010F3|nr:ABC transporter ATP-binding protein [Robertmurraya korlensis]MCM3601878.1 ABC transporter ATP-binding protein [Robertmurraya korlensis]
MTYRLEMKEMTKKYGDFLANDGISIQLKKGEVLAIVGENGAGKTTLMRMLYGLEQPTSGEIILNGKQAQFYGPQDAIEQGIGMVHQHFMLFSDFTVTENIVIGHEPMKNGFFNRKMAAEQVQKLSDQYKIQVDPSKKAGDCSVGEQQRIEILKVLYQGAEIIILDEPTAVLTPFEVEELLKTIRYLADQGKSIILITHKLPEVMKVADHVTVLRNGRVTGNVRKVDTSIDQLATMMVGRELQQLSERNQHNGEPLLELEAVSIKGKSSKPVLDQLSLTVHRGEIVGVAGVSGNGQSELIQAISGLISVDQGDIRLDGTKLMGKSVAFRRNVGLAHIPEDRYLWGAAKEATIEETGVMGYHNKKDFNKYSFILKSSFQEVVKTWIDRFEIKVKSLDDKSGNLSGGNLQKLIVARELGFETDFLIAAEPTRGVDIGAMEYIHEAILEKRNRGDGILLVSSELSEILLLSDRIAVMFEGKIVDVLDRQDATEERLSVLMAGGKEDESSTKNTTTA